MKGSAGARIGSNVIDHEGPIVDVNRGRQRVWMRIQVLRRIRLRLCMGIILNGNTSVVQRVGGTVSVGRDTGGGVGLTACAGAVPGIGVVSTAAVNNSTVTCTGGSVDASGNVEGSLITGMNVTVSVHVSVSVCVSMGVSADPGVAADFGACLAAAMNMSTDSGTDRSANVSKNAKVCERGSACW